VSKTSNARRVIEREKAKQAAEIANERERLAAVKADPAKALKNLKSREATRRRNLLDPNWGEKRLFPAWYPGQTTAAYIRTFQALQSKQDGPGLTFKHRDDGSGAPFNWDEQADPRGFQ
jgi:hypothetical protein